MFKYRIKNIYVNVIANIFLVIITSYFVLLGIPFIDTDNHIRDYGMLFSCVILLLHIIFYYSLALNIFLDLKHINGIKNMVIILFAFQSIMSILCIFSLTFDVFNI